MFRMDDSPVFQAQDEAVADISDAQGCLKHDERCRQVLRHRAVRELRQPGDAGNHSSHVQQAADESVFNPVRVDVYKGNGRYED
jgi:hypothetical protein